MSSKGAGKTSNEQAKGQAGQAMSTQKQKRGRKATDHIGRDNKQIRDRLLQLQANEEGDGGRGDNRTTTGKHFVLSKAFMYIISQIDSPRTNIKYALSGV
jgi:hypothetical protein